MRLFSEERFDWLEDNFGKFANNVNAEKVDDPATTNGAMGTSISAEPGITPVSGCGWKGGKV